MFLLEARRLICAVCGKPITKDDIWVMIDEKPYHIGCAPLRKSSSSSSSEGSSHSSPEYKIKPVGLPFID